MSATGSENHVFGYLLRRLAPLVVAPPGPLPPQGIQLRGIARAGDAKVRVAFSEGAEMVAGVAFEFDLISSAGQLNADAAVDWLRIMASNLPSAVLAGEWRSDSHANRIIDAGSVGYSNELAVAGYDQGVFDILSTMIHGGGFPWFEDLYTCAGFMLVEGRRWRIYVRLAASGETFGIDVPLVSKDGYVISGFGSELPRELASIIRQGDLHLQRILNVEDEYCRQVFAMDAWLGPDAS